MRQRLQDQAKVIQQQLGAQLDPITFVSAQVHVLIKELWPDERDQTLFDIKVWREIVDRLGEVGAEVRKQKLVEGIDMSPPANRAMRRQQERQNRPKGITNG